MEKSERSSFTALDFLQWEESGALVISPKFQRRGVWSRAARSYLIDTLLLGMPIPPIYLRVVQDKNRTRIIREVVDGQQRMSAVLDYVNGKYSLAKNIESDCVGYRFDDLDNEYKDKILQYPFICEVFYGIEDAEILSIFARLNTNSVRLNAQELRNGKYFGPFKRSAYGLGYEHLEFWRHHRIFTDTRIARMQEAELASELMILEIDGIQDKKTSIDQFYKKYDEDFPNKERIESRFRTVIDFINNAGYESLGETEFRRVPLFYSLFAAVFHRLYGLPKFSLSTPKKGKFAKSEIESLSDAIIELSEYVELQKNEENIPSSLERFVTACLRQTDNIRPRTIRTETIYKTAFR